jgi:hypothetical protein
MQVDPTSKPSLAPILSYRRMATHDSVLTQLDFKEDTLAVLWFDHGSNTHSISAVSVASAAVDTALLSLQYQWQIDRPVCLIFQRNACFTDYLL